MNRSVQLVLMGTALLICGSCSSTRGPRYPTAITPLKLDRVVLYRNGIGYFERSGEVDGNLLTLRVRKDQVNDLLKSLTVIDRSRGKALSVSMPLDPQSWQNAALSLLAPGQGNLAEMLEALKGVRVSVDTRERSVEGRVVMVEPMRHQPPEDGQAEYMDYKLSLLDGSELNVLRLSEVTRVGIEEGDLVLQLHRRLDSSSGEGMFQQLALDIRLSGEGPHDLQVSYVVSAPLWKPTYRVVLGEKGSGEALLQGWAVVDNVSGESWENVLLGLTSGAPLAFRYDLHTPQEMPRPDLTPVGISRRARVAVGETSYGEEAEDEKVSAKKAPVEKKMEALSDGIAESRRHDAKPRAKAARAPAASRAGMKQLAPESLPARAPALDMRSLQSSTQADARAERVSGLTRFDLGQRVTVPDGSATMVALINQTVQGEQLFVFRPGGSGAGFEYNPYRVVRFQNSTDFALEPGPISIYSKGSFVGEGLSELVASQATATIPFAVEPRIIVRSREDYSDEEIKLVKIVRGVLEIQTFVKYSTVWSVKGMKTPEGYRVLVRHPRRGGKYELTKPKEKVEQLPDAYLVPVVVAPNKSKGTVTVVEQTPRRSSITIWDSRAPQLLTLLLQMGKLDAKSRARLEPIVKLRQKVGRIDTEVEGLKRQQQELDQRAEQTRDNLKAIKKDPLASNLRARLSRRLEQFTSEGDRIGRRIVELQSRRLEHKIDLEDRVRDLTIEAD